MRAAVATAALACLTAASRLRDDYPWYRTGDEIRSELQDLASNCPGVRFDLGAKSAINGGSNAGQDVQLDVIHVSQDGGSKTKAKALFVFGEHARELISPESALRFLQVLCGRGGYASRDLVRRVLDSTDITVVPNANPMSRQRVEAGDYCKRTNEDGVDLNRNWGDGHRDTDRKPGDEMYPGDYGFSEPETQILRDIATDVKPDIFLSVHSGAYLLGTPFGYTDTPADNEDEMLDVLRPISTEFCGGRCPFGDLSELIHYKNQGCDIDWVRTNLGTRYAFTWEIYVGGEARNFYEEEAAARSGNRKMAADASMFFMGNSLNLLQAGHRRLRGRAGAGRPEHDEFPGSCFQQFNPGTQEATEEVVDNWSRAFLTLCDLVSNRQSHATSAAANGTATPGSGTAAELPPPGPTAGFAADVPQALPAAPPLDYTSAAAPQAATTFSAAAAPQPVADVLGAPRAAAQAPLPSAAAAAPPDDSSDTVKRLYTAWTP